jgi:hypothetical protein
MATIAIPTLLLHVFVGVEGAFSACAPATTGTQNSAAGRKVENLIVVSLGRFLVE